MAELKVTSVKYNDEDIFEIKDSDLEKSQLLSKISENQRCVTIVYDEVTNLNGYPAPEKNHYSTSDVSAGGYTILEVLYEDERCTEAQAKRYMQFMTGSNFLPQYNYDRPQDCLIITAEGIVWKPQYSEDNGLQLYKMFEFSGGTKLYKHLIGVGTAYVRIVNTRSTSFGTNISLMDMFMSGLLNDKYISCIVETGSSQLLAFPDASFVFKYINSDGTIGTLTSADNVSDVVTPL